MGRRELGTLCTAAGRGDLARHMSNGLPTRGGDVAICDSGDVYALLSEPGDRPIGATHAHATRRGVHAPGEHPHPAVLASRITGCAASLTAAILVGMKSIAPSPNETRIPRHLTLHFSAV